MTFGSVVRECALSLSTFLKTGGSGFCDKPDAIFLLTTILGFAVSWILCARLEKGYNTYQKSAMMVSVFGQDSMKQSDIQSYLSPTRSLELESSQMLSLLCLIGYALGTFAASVEMRHPWGFFRTRLGLLPVTITSGIGDVGVAVLFYSCSHVLFPVSLFFLDCIAHKLARSQAA